MSRKTFSSSMAFSATLKTKEFSPKKAKTTLSKKKEKELLIKLSKFEKTKKYTNKNLTIASLATQMGTNTTYLSEIINKHKKKNFSQYINELRIKYIVQKIDTDPVYQNYKISYLAKECGLSYSSFTAIFKEFIGLTPSAFIEKKKHCKT